MIVISEQLVLSPALAASANAPLIGWRNLATFGNIVADFEETGFPAINLANPSTSSLQKWVGVVDASAQHVTIAVDTEEEIDYLAVARHNFGTAQIAASVEGDSGAGFDTLAGPVLPADDKPLLFRFDPQSLTSIRLKLEPGEAAPSAAVIYTGKLLLLQRNIYVGHTPIPYGRRTQVTNGKAESGDFLGRIITGESVETAVAIQNLTPAWYRSEMDPFVAAGAGRPFFFAWRPGSYPNEVGYSWFTNDPRPVNQRNNGMMQIDLQMAGIA